MRQVTIPTVIDPGVAEELVNIARNQVMRVGLNLAGQNLDGRTIRSATWPGLFYITTQKPTAGSTPHRGDLIHVPFVADGDNHNDVPAQRVDPKSSLSARTEAENLQRSSADPAKLWRRGNSNLLSPRRRKFREPARSDGDHSGSPDYRSGSPKPFASTEMVTPVSVGRPPGHCPPPLSAPGFGRPFAFGSSTQCNFTTIFVSVTVRSAGRWPGHARYDREETANPCSRRTWRILLDPVAAFFIWSMKVQISCGEGRAPLGLSDYLFQRVGLSV